MTTTVDLLGDRYSGYLYAYPHKTAYRPLDPPQRLESVWAAEAAGPRFLYVHVPFCEMRCGYCNLFTLSRPRGDLVDAWRAALRRQADVVAEQLGKVQVGSLAIGGGTPTMLSPSQLDELLNLIQRLGWTSGTPASVEVSPRTATADRLQVLVDRGIERISIGIESFDDGDLHSLGRPQKNSTAAAALDAIRAAGPTRLNIDLIYGAPGMTERSWIRSLRAALEWTPEELYLYPLYRRPLTPLGRRDIDDDRRPAMYEAARSLLMDAGYEQRSMRLFRRIGTAVPSNDYDCQDDGMIGLGCGARSYTRSLHYSSEYAVGRAATAEIIEAYVGATDADFALVTHGFELDLTEQQRRYIVKSILRVDGLDLDAYSARFGSEATLDHPLLERLMETDHLARHHGVVGPTPLGLAWSDAIGPAFASTTVRAAMDEIEPR